MGVSQVTNQFTRKSAVWKIRYLYLVGRERRSLAVLYIPGMYQPRGCCVSLWLPLSSVGLPVVLLARSKKCTLILPWSQGKIKN